MNRSKGETVKTLQLVRSPRRLVLIVVAVVAAVALGYGIGADNKSGSREGNSCNSQLSRFQRNAQ